MVSRHGGKRGFSLIELVIVISVLTLLAAVVAPQVSKLVEKSKINRLISDIKSIKKSLISRREFDRIIDALKRADYKVTQAARESGLSRATFYRKMDKHGIRPADLN